jgi:hypothetical protein
VQDVANEGRREVRQPNLQQQQQQSATALVHAFTGWYQ